MLLLRLFGVLPFFCFRETDLRVLGVSFVPKPLSSPVGSPPATWPLGGFLRLVLSGSSAVVHSPPPPGRVPRCDCAAVAFTRPATPREGPRWSGGDVGDAMPMHGHCAHCATHRAHCVFFKCLVFFNFNVSFQCISMFLFTVWAKLTGNKIDEKQK